MSTPLGNLEFNIHFRIPTWYGVSSKACNPTYRSTPICQPYCSYPSAKKQQSQLLTFQHQERRGGSNGGNRQKNRETLITKREIIHRVSFFSRSAACKYGYTSMHLNSPSIYHDTVLTLSENWFCCLASSDTQQIGNPQTRKALNKAQDLLFQNRFSLLLLKQSLGKKALQTVTGKNVIC